MEKKKLTFAQASKHILELNNNQPMTSDEILIEIYKLKLPLNSMGDSPERTLNTILNRRATNSTASKQSKNKDFTIIRGFELADKYILAEYEATVSEEQIKLSVENLIAGYKIYEVVGLQIRWYRYFCIHPHAENYHILIDINDDPIRMFVTELQAILDMGLRTYDEAKLLLADKLEEKAKKLRKDNNLSNSLG